MTLKELARHRLLMICSPDTEIFLEILELAYLVNEKEFLAEKSDFTPGGHEIRVCFT